MGKMVLTVFIGLLFIAAGATASLAHHAGGVEIGDLETGSVIGQPFKELPIDMDFHALENVGGKKVWYPPVAILSVRDRGSNPVVLKVTNDTSSEHGFYLTAGDSYAPPSSLNVKIVLKPGETKYIGIPTSDLTYTVVGNVLRYKCHLHEAHAGGQLLILK
jgi:hypothetical protein